MDIASYLSPSEQFTVAQQVETYNRALGGARTTETGMGKDDFLKILLAQLTHQDPTQPMEDREFVAQMAQFSTLEQMTNVSQELANVHAMIARSQAFSLLGKTVEIMLGEKLVSGTVEEVTGGASPQLLVDGRYYDFADVERVRR